MDPISMTIATAIVGKAAEGMVGDAWQALKKAVRSRFSKDEAATKALERATSSPQDEQSVVNLADYIEQYIQEDPGFRRDLEFLLRQPRPQEQNVLNSVQGNISGTSIQGGTVNIGQVGDRRG